MKYFIIKYGLPGSGKSHIDTSIFKFLKLNEKLFNIIDIDKEYQKYIKKKNISIQCYNVIKNKKKYDNLNDEEKYICNEEYYEKYIPFLHKNQNFTYIQQLIKKGKNISLEYVLITNKTKKILKEAKKKGYKLILFFLLVSNEERKKRIFNRSKNKKYPLTNLDNYEKKYERAIKGFIDIKNLLNEYAILDNNNINSNKSFEDKIILHVKNNKVKKTIKTKNLMKDNYINYFFNLVDKIKKKVRGGGIFVYDFKFIIFMVIFIFIILVLIFLLINFNNSIY